GLARARPNLRTCNDETMGCGNRTDSAGGRHVSCFAGAWEFAVWRGEIMHAAAIRFMRGASLALTMMLAAAAARAETYPSRPITVVVPFAGGSASDVVTRIVLERMSASMGQPIIVENRPGAGGNTGTAAVAKATPDGYTIVGSGSGPIAANRTLYKDLGYDPEKDLEAI